MQERAAALYIALFLVLAAGSYGMIGAAEAPTFAYDDPEHELSVGDEFDVGDVTYTLDGIDDEDELEATITWEEIVEQDASLADGDEIERNNETWIVSLSDEEDPETFELRQSLPEDANTTEIDGVEHVIVEEDEDGVVSVPVDEYDELDRETYAVGDTFVYEGEETTVESVTNESVLLTWSAPVEQQNELEQGEQTTIGDQEFIAVFPNDSTLQLSTDIEAYQEHQDTLDQFTDRVNGLWGVFNLSIVGIVVLGALAFLPVRE